MGASGKPQPKAAHRAPQRKARILLVDDHPMVRRGLAEVISGEPDLEVSAEAEDAPAALRRLGNKSFDLAIVDISLQNGNGIELIEQIRARHRRTRVLVYSMHEESLFAERALRAGALGYINKAETSEKVLAAIRLVLRDEVAVSPAINQRIMRIAVGGTGDLSQTSLETLSNRELEVFELLGEGHTTVEIAKQLYLSPKTVETYRSKIKQKLALKNAAELTRHAMQWAVLQKPPTT